MTIIDNAIYVDGIRTANPKSLSETFERMRERQGMSWIGLYRPSEEEIREVADEFGIHALVVEDALGGHQRSKLERYGDVLFMVLRPARYLDDTEEVEFGEVHVVVGPDFVVTIRHAESPDLGRVRRRLEGDPALLARGPEAVLYAILDEVVDEYAPVLAGLENDIDEIESQLFEDDVDANAAHLRARPRGDRLPARDPAVVGDAGGAAARFEKYLVDEELQRYLRDVLDHTLRVADRANTFRTVLDNALTVESTIVARRQNEEMRRMTELSIRQNEEVKKISGWAAILFAPTLIGTIYGMNFDHMPELHWVLGYPMAIAMMLAMGLGLYVVFKRKGWL